MLSDKILIPVENLTLKYAYKSPKKTYAYENSEDPEKWQVKCRAKLRELIGCDLKDENRQVKTHHTTVFDFGTVHSLIMQADETLSVPAYLLVPDEIKFASPVMAVQGHGEVNAVLGLYDDYHHSFGLELCRSGFVVLVPELRGFGNLENLAAHDEGRRLKYWRWGEHMVYTLVTDAILKGHTLIGDTIRDLYAWGSYLGKYVKQDNYAVAGISYGGDLALILSALDNRINKTFASGTLGSMNIIFDKCYNAPAHCIPNILKYMDRQEIASCIAPRSLCVHYGALDTPSPENGSASFNETAVPSFDEVKKFYGKLGAEDNVSLIISPDLKHEMDNNALIGYLQS